MSTGSNAADQTLTIVNPQRKYAPVALIEPPSLGYIHVAATVEPPAQPGPPFPGRSRRKAALLTQLTSLAAQLERLDTVTRATVYRAVLVPPAGSETRQRVTRVARYDVAVLVETTSPEVTGEVQGAEPYQAILQATWAATDDVHVMNARCPRRVGDVDKTRQGLFLFNYFDYAGGAGAQVPLQLWDHLAGWYAVETGMDNSTLLAPSEDSPDADYVFVNHARWDASLPRFMWNQFSKPSFRSYVLANLQANQTVSMPILYRLA